MDKIKPCPFCGEKDELPVIRERYGIHRVVCNRCDTYGPKGYGEEKAVLLWNHAPRVGDNNCDYLNFTGGCNTFTIY